MSYKYYNLSPPMTTASGILVDTFQSLLTEQFSVATDVFTISEEYILGSGSYRDLNVRIVGAISAVTNEKLSDDFKTFLFEDIGHAVGLGVKFLFNSNYWITVNTEAIKNLAASATVRRCNNMLRWVDENGVYYEEPVALEYKISRPRDEMGTSDPVTPAGYITCFAQLNSKTVKIKGNQRFLFGPASNRVCYRVFGNGVRAYMNQETLDDESGQLLELSMGGYQVNEDVDDLLNGIADKYKTYPVSTSASQVGNLYILVSPTNNRILKGDTNIFNVNYYSGCSVHSGSFVFTASGSVIPGEYYTLTTLGSNSFSILNNEAWLEDDLNILCSGSSGSRILNFELRRGW